ncbi:MAG: hypothetical protein ACRDNX_11020 [Gaiellaceae bacterium]
MAADELLARLREIAREDGVSLGEVIRQGLEWRARTQRRVPSFIGAVASGDEPHDTGARHEEILLEYFRERDSRL